LFADLDAGNVVFIEFAMMPDCQTCIAAGKKMEIAKKNINAKTLNFSALEENSKHSLIQDSILYLMYTAINKNLNVEKKNKKSSIITLEVSSSDQVFSKIFELVHNGINI
jgi:hypothetical protein